MKPTLNVVYNKNDVIVIQVFDKETMLSLEKGTKWDTYKLYDEVFYKTNVYILIREELSYLLCLEMGIILDKDTSLEEYLNNDGPKKETATSLKYTTEFINFLKQISLTDPHAAVWYCREILGGRGPELEPIILKDKLATLWYAQDVIHGEWREAEEVLKDSFLFVIYESFARKKNVKEETTHLSAKSK